MAFRLPLVVRHTGIRHVTPRLKEHLTSGFGKAGGAWGMLSARYVASGLGEFGSGSGRGGGAGGPIREAGGPFGQREVAEEEIYFRRLQSLQLKKLKEHMQSEVDEHEKRIREHQEAIERHKKKMQKIQEHEKELQDVK